jgi:hypothetical protein
MSWWKATAALAILGGCAEVGASPGDAAFESYRRGFDRTFTEEPFVRGALAVVARENGELMTFGLVPCQGGAAICAGSAQGPAGQLSRTPEYFVVDGLYGRRFWLSYGGDGYVERAGIYIPLAWDARINGTGFGTDGALETPFRHD